MAPKVQHTQKLVDIVNLQNKEVQTSSADQLEIIYFTDPLCCWSWAIEPQLRKIQFEYDGKIKWHYRMGGLLPNWNNYHDEVNSVSRPMQMGPVWMHAQYVSGMPMDFNLWMHDPPASSYPACIAFKNALMQSEAAGIRYLRLLREAVMIKGENLAKEEVLINIAERLEDEPQYKFSAAIFRDELKEENALNAFREDLRDVQYQQIKRFPTFIIKRGKKGNILTGYRPYQSLREAILQVAPGITKNDLVINPDEYDSFWGFLTDREKDAITVTE